MSPLIFTIIVTLIGAAVYLLPTGEAKALGLKTYFAGLLVTLLVLAHNGVRLIQ